MRPNELIHVLRAYHESKLALSQRFSSKDIDKVATAIMKISPKKLRRRGRPKDPRIQAIIKQVEKFMASRNEELARREIAFFLKLDPQDVSYALAKLRREKKIQMFGYTGANPRWIHRNFL